MEALHVIALLKGAVEGDPYRHFASFGAVDMIHFPNGERAGLLSRNRHGEIVPTSGGRAFYLVLGLDRLPNRRANYWVGPVIDQAESVYMKLVDDTPK